MADNKKRLEEINALLKEGTVNAEERAKLTKEENYLLKEQIKLQSESLDLSSSAVDSIKELFGYSTKRTTSDANLLKVNKEINKTILNQETGVASIETINKRIAKNTASINKAKVIEFSLSKNISEEGKKRINYIKSEGDKIKSKQKLIDEELAKTKEQGGINLDLVKSLQDQQAQHYTNIDLKGKLLKDSEAQLLFTQQNIKELEAQNAEREKELKLSKSIKGQLGVAGKLTSALGAIPGIGGSAAAALEEVTKELEYAANNAEELPTKGETAKMVFKSLGKNLVKDLLDPTALAAAAMKMFVDAIKLVDKEAGALAKDMGISYQEALRFGGEMNKVASASGDIAVTQQGLMKSQKSLNEYFGQSAKFSGEIAEEFASIQKRTNLSDKAMGFFTKSAMKSGKDTKSILLNVNKTTLELNKQNKMSLSNKQVQEGIAKLSNSIKLSAGGNVEELTKAVFASKKLGASMSQIEGIASSLLDFESSIQSELEAELLLGQDINLEKARQFALEGDMVGVGNEVLKNKAIMNAFDTKNVIAQEAAAKALGMSRDDLANMVTEQKNLAVLQKAFDGKGVENMADAQAEYNKLRKEGMSAEEAGAKVGDESLANQLETISAAEKMENIMTRIQQLFMSLAEPIMAIVTPIIDLLVPALQGISFVVGMLVEGFTFIKDLISESVPAMVTFGVVLSGILIQQQALAFKKKQGLAYDTAQYLMGKKKLILDNVLLAKQKMSTAMEGKTLMKAIGSAAMSAFRSMALIPFVGPILGAAAAASAVALGMGLFNKAGDMSSQADGKTQVSTKEGGLFELSPNDDLVAAPGAVDKMNQKGGGGAAVVQDNAALLAGINRLIAINQVIANKSPVIEMGGNEVGQGINKAEREIQ